jgi:hypothetical protein
MTEVNSNDSPPTKEEKQAKKAGKAERKRLHLISETSKKYVGRVIRAPLADHSTSWHVGQVQGVDVDVNGRVILLINHAKYGPLRLLQKKAILA